MRRVNKLLKEIINVIIFIVCGFLVASFIYKKRKKSIELIENKVNKDIDKNIDIDKALEVIRLIKNLKNYSKL